MLLNEREDEEKEDEHDSDEEEQDLENEQEAKLMAPFSVFCFFDGSSQSKPKSLRTCSAFDNFGVSEEVIIKPESERSFTNGT